METYILEDILFIHNIIHLFTLIMSHIKGPQIQREEKQTYKNVVHWSSILSCSKLFTSEDICSLKSLLSIRCFSE